MTCLKQPAVEAALESSTKHEFDEQLCCAMNVIYFFFLLVKCLMLDWKEGSLQSNSLECNSVKMHGHSVSSDEH